MRLPLLSARRLALLAVIPACLRAQAPDDGLMMPAKTLTTGVSYGYERWNEYWEGSLKRSNGNIGTVTTRTATLIALYGVTDRVSVASTLPYVWTSSNHVLQGMRGEQDLTVAVKYRLLTTPSAPTAHR